MFDLRGIFFRVEVPFKCNHLMPLYFKGLTNRVNEHPRWQTKTEQLAGVHFQLLGSFYDLRYPVAWLTDPDDCRQGHTALSRGTECSTNQRRQRRLFVSVRQDDTVILGRLFQHPYNRTELADSEKDLILCDWMWGGLGLEWLGRRTHDLRSRVRLRVMTLPGYLFLTGDRLW